MNLKISDLTNLFKTGMNIFQGINKAPSNYVPYKYNNPYTNQNNYPYQNNNYYKDNLFIQSNPVSFRDTNQYYKNRIKAFLFREI